MLKLRIVSWKLLKPDKCVVTEGVGDLWPLIISSNTHNTLAFKPRIFFLPPRLKINNNCLSLTCVSVTFNRQNIRLLTFQLWRTIRGRPTVMQKPRLEKFGRTRAGETISRKNQSETNTMETAAR